MIRSIVRVCVVWSMQESPEQKPACARSITLSRCFFNALQNYFSYHVCDGREDAEIQLPHSKWVLFFRPLGKVPYSQVEVAELQQLQMQRWMTLPGDYQVQPVYSVWMHWWPKWFLFCIRMLRWLSISSTWGRTSPNVIRLRTLVKLFYQLFSCSPSWMRTRPLTSLAAPQD